MHIKMDFPYGKVAQHLIFNFYTIIHAMDDQSKPVTPDFSAIAFIYFDLDDTLIDHKKAQKRALVDVWSQHPVLQGIEPEVFAAEFAASNYRLWEEYRNGNVSQHELRRLRFDETFRRLGIRPPDWREIDRFYMDCYSRYWDWIHNAREALIRISENYPVGIMTNGFIFVQKKKIEYFSLNRYSRHLIISEEVGHLKPDRRIFEFGAEKAGCRPEQLLYVGDSYSSDVAGGAHSGWNTAWYNPSVPESGPDPESNLANFVFSEYRQLLEVLEKTRRE